MEDEFRYHKDNSYHVDWSGVDWGVEEESKYRMVSDIIRENMAKELHRKQMESQIQSVKLNWNDPNKANSLFEITEYVFSLI